MVSLLALHLFLRFALNSSSCDGWKNYSIAVKYAALLSVLVFVLLLLGYLV